MTPYVDDGDFRLYVGDALDVLRQMPDASVDCCVTSPPYWSLRDYGVDGQLGLEPTPDAYVAAMVAVFREVRRVLTPAATCWINLGDSYFGTGRGPSDLAEDRGFHTKVTRDGFPLKGVYTHDTLKSKDLCGIPWRVAFALQQDGWYLRSDIIWAKPNPMPESVTDRPTKAHEYVFLLSKSPRYFFDAEAVREPAEWARWGDQTYSPAAEAVYGQRIKPRRKSEIEHLNGRNVQANGSEAERRDEIGGTFNNNPRLRANVGRNVRSVWEIATQPYPDAHFAVFPEELPRRCILAGCPEWVCRVCGKPRERIVESKGKERVSWGVDRKARVLGTPGEPVMRNIWETVGWSDCGHNDYRPGVVLDPFGGSGTTALVARRHGRRSVLIELNPTYAELAARRLQQLSLLAEGAT